VAWIPQGVRKGGFIIQKVVITEDWEATRNLLVRMMPWTESQRYRHHLVTTFWEAWEVDAKRTVFAGYAKDGLVPAGPSHDEFNLDLPDKGVPRPSEGSIKVQG